MSLADFQRALADMVAAPDLALAVRNGAAGALDGYDLSARERSRLETVAAQPGMDVSCTLYRSNRLVPIALLLPYTCFVLGERIRDVAVAFWSTSPTDLQFAGEVDRFAAFLRERLRSEELDEPLLEELLDYELATKELRFLPRRRLAEDSANGEGALVLHPLVRLVHFRHDPAVLLARLAANEPPPYDLDEGDFPVLLVARGDELEARVLDPALAALLEALRDGEATIAPEDAELLVREGLAVRRAVT